jgi:murein L,D-transpeptidase YafK
MVSTTVSRLILSSAALLVVAGCEEQRGKYPARAYAPVPAATVAKMEAKGSSKNAPVLVRAYKQESEIEIWKQTASGEYALVKSYPVCRWSGQLGPKKKEGDRQVPEGFYYITSAQMNPNSAFWLSFNVGYPNPLERAMARTGGDIMVHGTCSSRGCFAMTNDQMEELYAIMRESFAGGQKAVQFQSFPFRMTAENLAKFRHDPNMPFWKNLKEGNDHFEVTKREPQVGYCGQKYYFNASAEGGRPDPVGVCPTLKVDETLAEAVNAKQQSDTKKVAELIERGTPAISVRYADGSQHESFRESSSFVALAGDRVISQRADRTARLGDVSRPEAIGAVEVVHLDANGTPKNAAPSNTASVAKPTQQAPAQAVATVAPAASTGTVQAVPAPAPASGFTMFSGFGSLFGDKKEQAPVSAPQQSATNAVPEKSVLQRWFGGSETSAPAGATSFPATVPLPPRRAGQDNAERVSDAAAARKLMPGAQAIVTADLTAAQ